MKLPLELPLPRALFAAALSLALVLGPLPAALAAENLKTESRMPFAHNIPLRDADGRIITPPKAFDEKGQPQEPRGNPYSPAQTCGKCHEYAVISKGWHFNAAKGNAKAGRPGEPWMFTDQASHTQIPLSYRGWPGTFKPAEIGLSDIDFLNQFARHFPGGGPGEPEKKPDPADPATRRMLVTGSLEIDCLLCHEASGRYNHEARFTAVNGQNYKWASAIGAGLGNYGGFKNAGAIADSWKPGAAVPTNVPPIKYDRARFDGENNVSLNVTRRPSPNNCYYCHTSESAPADGRWHGDRDVHLRAGLSCIDCHRNGVDHLVVRGYEGELKDRTVTPEMIAIRVKLILRDHPEMDKQTAAKLAKPLLEEEQAGDAALSCRGCHSGEPGGATFKTQAGGRLGAPRPLHQGLPPLHLEKLSCTACHSGPFPGTEPQIVHTSLAHKLGIPAPPRGENTAPVIVQPVFLRGADGRITPNKMVWPSYWARQKDGKLTVLLPEEVVRTGKLPTPDEDDLTRDPYNSTPLTDAQIQTVIEALAADKTKGEPVFIAAGKMYHLQGGKLTAEENDAAKPYAWALAHDVRPASQALGARGCADCHAADAPVYFSSIVARGPVAATNVVSKRTWELRGDDEKLASTFAWTFNFRLMLKIITFGSALVVLGVLLNRALAGIDTIARKLQK